MEYDQRENKEADGAFDRRGMMNSPQIGVGVRGSLIGCPVEAAIWTNGDSLSWKGVLHVRDKGVGDLFPRMCGTKQNPDDTVSALVAMVDGIIGKMSFDMAVRHTPDLTSYELDIDALKIRILAGAAATAVAVQFSKDQAVSGSGIIGTILNALHEAQKALGIRELLLLYRSGPGIAVADLVGVKNASKLPSPVSQHTWLAYGRFAFPDDSPAGIAIDKVLGIRALDVYLGINPETSSYRACLSFGIIDNALFKSDELYLSVGLVGGAPSFSFKGSFVFKFIPDVTFIANCDITVSSFSLAAAIDATDRIPVPFIPGFYIAEGGLLVGIAEGAPIFGLYATIYIREMMAFGAIIVALEGGQVPTPRLLSAAIDPVSLPLLFRNLTGDTLDGLDALDIISIDRLARIELPAGFNPSILDNRDTDGLAAAFNKAVANPSLNLDPGRIHLRKLDGGYALVDQARMRHYFVDVKGGVSLQAQFYLSTQPSPFQFGSYTVAPGIFFCGAVVLFGKRFEALFSLRKDDGLLAYAKVDRIDFRAADFTLFSLRASDDPSKDPRPIGSGGLADQFIPAQPTGVVFFLTASKKEVSFYLSGHVEFLGIISLDVRLIYMARTLSLHTDYSLWGIRVVLALDLSWSDLLKSRFAFTFSIDTSGLLAALTAVTKAIDGAIEALKTSMRRASASLDDAQSKVNQLHIEIDNLDRRIDACAAAIRIARWWEAVFVAIGKGAEIAAYEVAKAGIWTAIGVATAALQLAKVAVNTFGSLGAGLLELVNLTIRAATNLLFLHRAEIIADVSPQAQHFKAAIAFRALGKEYAYSAEVSLNLLQGDLLKFLADQLLSFLGPDLASVSSGNAPRLAARDINRVKAIRAKLSAPRLVAPGIDSPDTAIPSMQAASEELLRVSQILDLLQKRYRAAFGEDLALFAKLNADFTTALHLSSSGLDVAAQTAETDAFSALLERVGALDRTSLSPVRRKKLEAALDDLSQQLDAKQHIATAVKAASRARNAAVRRTQASYPSRKKGAPANAAETDEKMSQFLHDVEAEIHARYGEELTGYINLSMESSLARQFSRAHAKVGSRRTAANSARTTQVKSSGEKQGYRERM
jgi:hypothetical protein